MTYDPYYDEDMAPEEFDKRLAAGQPVELVVEHTYDHDWDPDVDGPYEEEE